MDQAELEKLKRFVADEQMSRAVYNFLLAEFLGIRGQTDVQLLAASRLSIDYLQQAWRGLVLFAEPKKSESKIGNVGL